MEGNHLLKTMNEILILVSIPLCLVWIGAIIWSWSLMEDVLHAGFAGIRQDLAGIQPNPDHRLAGCNKIQ